MAIAGMVASLALARSPTLHPSAEAEVVLLPRTVPDRIELGVYHNRAPIALDVRSWRDPAIDHARVVDVGGGTAFVVIALARPGVVAELARSEGQVEVRLVPGRPTLRAVDEVPTVEALFAGLPRQPAPWPDGLALAPLMREARTFALPADEHRLPIPRMTQHRPEPELADAAAPTWDDVQRWRTALPELRDGRARSAAHYRLGRAHKLLGLPREAAYYFGQAAETGYPPAHVLLERADAALATRQWDVARQACGQAWRRGADEALVVECLGVLALATDQPAAAPTGRALAAVAAHPAAHQLAGELLLRDGFAAEAAPLLARATEALPPEAAERAWAALGDARLALGDTDGARRAYLATPHVLLADALEVREVATRMLTDGIRGWPAWIPTLVGFADRGGPAAEDALYLLAQVHDRYGDHEAVAADLARLWAGGVQRTDVAPRLLAACTARAEALSRGERNAELIALYEVCWQDGISAHVQDVRLPELASLASERLGMREEALQTQLELTTILAGVGREAPLQLGRVAHLQVATGRAERALETVSYARRLTREPDALGRLDLDEAEARAALDDLDGALALLARAGRIPAIAAEARERAAVLRLRSGRCAEGVRDLGERLRAGPIGAAPPGELELAWVGCAVELGRPEEAVAAAELALARATDDWTRDEARWLATAVAARTGVALPDGLRSAATSWATVAAEEARHEAFLERLAAWTRGR
jgi:tetratricopeptide (TPR) repeat protein